MLFHDSSRFWTILFWKEAPAADLKTTETQQGKCLIIVDNVRQKKAAAVHLKSNEERQNYFDEIQTEVFKPIDFEWYFIMLVP